MDTQAACLSACSAAAETLSAAILSVSTGSVFALSIVDSESQWFCGFN